MVRSEKSRRPLSRLEKAAVILQVAVAGTFGIVGLVQSDDPDWGGLLRFLVLMMTALWFAGIVGSVFLALVFEKTAIRLAILLVVPLAAFAVMIGLAYV
ncbi:MAG: hypothetical protein DWP92_00945 [Armatimonadetes bacterium]|nr:MAG: hypothetical protein DWP92_00945 [Armatimonadota bacterium]